MGNCLCADRDTPVPNVDPVTDVSIYHHCTSENTPYVSYENIRKKVKVLRIVDGDTVDIAMVSDDTNKIFKYRVRLYGIDTPEKKPLKSNPDREKEMEAAKKSSQGLHKKIEENRYLVTILLSKPDKYGRLLGTLYDEKGVDINQWMVHEGFATPYFGKTKKSFAETRHSTDDIYYVDE